MKQIYYLILIFLVCSISFNNAFAQKEGNIWCFGNNAGIDFNSGSPVFFPGVQLSQWEGVSSIANAGGQLLFYSDGISVWNRNNIIMPNGSGLTGGVSSTQSALIVKQPGANPNYYLFSAPETGTLNPLNYSIIDTTLQGGLGDVTLKNVNVYNDCDERVTACMHANGSDIWILSSTFSGDNIVAFLLSSTGLNLTPVISNNGLSHPQGTLTQIGYMKTSPQGNHIGIAYYDSFGPYELYDFDNTTGIATNPIVLDSSAFANAYGVEFSPDGTKFYGASHGAGYLVFQWDLNAGSPAAIKSSGTLVATATHGYAADLQLAPDGKIYLSQWTSNTLGRFDNPNGLGLASAYDDNAFVLPTGQTNGGLPNLRGGIFFQTPPIAIFSAPNHICPGTCTNFNNLSINGTSFVWSFPGANPTVSTDFSPMNICYNTPGSYSVTLIATNANGSDTITLNNYVTVYPTPPAQGILQNGDTLFANQNAVTYQWYFNGNMISGATDYFYVAPQSGNYSVVAADENACEVEAVINNVVATTSQLAPGSSWQLAIFPNPVTEILEIRNLKQDSKISIAIFNTLGETVSLPIATPKAISSKQPTCSIDVSRLAKGLYWLEVSDGKEFSRTSFVKK
jgi:PKD repeat protein